MSLLLVIFHLTFAQALATGSPGEVLSVSCDGQRHVKKENTSADPFGTRLQSRNSDLSDDNSLLQVKQQVSRRSALSGENSFLQVKQQVGRSVSTLSTSKESKVDLTYQVQSFLQWQHDAAGLAEYLQNRDQYLAWKRQHDRQQHSTAQGPKQVSPFEDLFPATRHMGEYVLSLFASSNAGQQFPDDIKNTTDDLEKKAADGAQATVNATKKAVEEAEEKAKGLSDKIKLLPRIFLQRIKKLGMGDMYFLSGLLFVGMIWLTLGRGEVISYFAWYFNHLYLCVHNHIYGHPMPSPTNNYHSIKVDTEATLATNGVAPPSSLMLVQTWDELQDGEQYVFGMVGFTKKRWDDAIQMVKQKPGLALCQALEVEWSDFTVFQKAMLDKIGLADDVWNAKDPENLAIHHKKWDEMSDFEKSLAGELGIDGDQNPNAWDLRKHEVWYRRYIDLEPDKQKVLRKLRFLREHWRPYHRVVMDDGLVDEIEEFGAGIVNFFFRAKKFCTHIVLLIWMVVQFTWTVLLIWKIRIFQALWSSCQTYLIFGAVIFLLVYLVYLALKPLFVWVEKHVVAEIRVIVAHVRDLWAMISRHLPKTVVTAVNEGCAGCGEAVHCHCFSAVDHFKKSGKSCACCGLPHLPCRSKTRDRKEEITCAQWFRGGKAKAKSAASPPSAATAGTRGLSDIPPTGTTAQATDDHIPVEALTPTKPQSGATSQGGTSASAQPSEPAAGKTATTDAAAGSSSRTTQSGDAAPASSTLLASAGSS